MMETTLDKHMAVMGRGIAKFVSDGLMPHNIDSRGVERFLGTPEDKKVFEAVIVWMLDEGIVRTKNVSTTIQRRAHLRHRQGLAVEARVRDLREVHAGGSGAIRLG
jgi:hypothetical protein